MEENTIKKKNTSYIKTLFQITTYNFKTILYFEIIFKILTLFIFIPLATGGFNLIMKVTGYSYLTIENILSFFKTPLAIILLLIIILYLTLVTMFDITTLIVIFDQSYKKIKIPLKDAVRISIKKSLTIFNPKNILLPVFLLFIIPFLNISLGTSVISSIKIPEFILDYITSNFLLISLLIILYAILIILLINWIYSIHYIVLEKNSFRKARKSSLELIKNKRIKDALTILVTEGIEIIIYLITIGIGIMLIYLINYYLSKIIVLESTLITIIWLFIAVSIIFFIAIFNSLNIAIISSLYYKHRQDNEEEIRHIEYIPNYNNKKNNKIFKIVNIVIMIACIISGSVLTYQVLTGKNDLKIEHVRHIEVTAHRGASVKYPENTMAAFKGAKELDADWIELDVEQTKDRKIVVIHDSNLKRITGLNKDVIDLTYDEIKTLDAGSHFSKEYKGEKIPLLEEVIKYANTNNIKLNIELKPTGKEIDFEKDVLKIIKDNHFEKECIITSGTYEVLKNVKDIDPDIKTFYVMSIAIGDITKLEYADGFSIEASNINKKLVNKIHNEGKEILAWTVNTEESINKMIDLSVDNIITDNISLAKDLIIQSKSSNLIIDYINMVRSIFG